MLQNSFFEIKGTIAKTASGQYTLGIFELLEENYDILSVCFAGLVHDMRSMDRKININEDELQIEWSLGGDMAFIHLERGLVACHSNHPCHLCRYSKLEFHKNDLKVIASKRRTLEECRDFLAKKGSRDGYDRMPIFDFIEFDHVHADSLHENLRTVNKLMKLLLKALKNYDKKTTTDLLKLPHHK